MRFIIVDIETAGLSHDAPIVEIGICGVDTKFGNASVEKFKLMDSRVLDPRFDRYKHGNEWIFSHSTLRVQDVLTAPTLEAVRPQIEKIFKAYPVTSYNKEFDLGCLAVRGIKPLRELPCAMKVCTGILKIEHEYYGHKYPTLEEAWRHFFGEGYKEAHRAFDDASHEADLIIEMCRRGLFPLRISDTLP